MTGWEVQGFIDRLTKRDDTNSERLVLEAISHLQAFSRDCDALREANTNLRAARRLALSEQDFRKLIAGETVERDGVSIILSDIGWTTMHDAIWDVLKAKQQQRAPR